MLVLQYIYVYFFNLAHAKIYTHPVCLYRTHWYHANETDVKLADGEALIYCTKSLSCGITQVKQCKRISIKHLHQNVSLKRTIQKQLGQQKYTPNQEHS